MNLSLQERDTLKELICWELQMEVISKTRQEILKNILTKLENYGN